MIVIDSKSNVFVTEPDLVNKLSGTPPYYSIFTPVAFSPKMQQINVLELNAPVERKLVNPWTYWNNDEKLESIRLQRNYLLSQTDWTALNDVPLSPSEKTAYENYRQQLRDFPDVVNVNLPIDQIIWPSKP